MLDVDSYLGQLNNTDAHTLASDMSVREQDADHDIPDRSQHDKSEMDDQSEFDRSQQSTILTNNKHRVGSSASSKRPAMYGKGKKSMKEFMKQQLAKTKQTGDHGVYMVCKSTFLGLNCGFV